MVELSNSIETDITLEDVEKADPYTLVTQELALVDNFPYFESSDIQIDTRRAM